MPTTAEPRSELFFDLDFDVLRRLVLSIIWRAHHAKLTGQKLGLVSLGHRHEERLRHYLSGEVQLEDWEYPMYCVIITAPDTKDVMLDQVVHPVPWREFGGRSYVTALMGFVFQTFVCSHPIVTEELDYVKLSRGKRARVIVKDMRDAGPFPMLAKHFGSLG